MSLKLPILKVDNTIREERFRRPASPLKQYADVITTSINVNASDVNNLQLLQSISSTGRDGINCTDVLRHFWTRDSDLMYRVMHKGQRLYKTAEELEDDFEGIRSALWKYWHIRKAGKISLDKLTNHFRCKRHKGFYRGMLWFLLPNRVQRILAKLRKEGRLDMFFF
jgi:hypothetical protein